MITPMVARLVRDPFDRDGWLFELKWDGLVSPNLLLQPGLSHGS